MSRNRNPSQGIFLGALILAACPGDGPPLGEWLYDATSTGRMESTGVSDSSASNGTTGATGGVAPTDPGTGSSGASFTSTGRLDGTTIGDDLTGTNGNPGTTGGNVCESDLRDGACVGCAKMYCCFEIEGCYQDVDCSCFYECYYVMPTIEAGIRCAELCDIGLADPLMPELPVGALHECVENECAGDCF